MELNNMWLFVSGSFHLAQRFQGPSKLYSLDRCIVPFDGGIMFHCVATARVVYLFLHPWAFGLISPFGCSE